MSIPDVEDWKAKDFLIYLLSDLCVSYRYFSEGLQPPEFEKLEHIIRTMKYIEETAMNLSYLTQKEFNSIKRKYKVPLDVPGEYQYSTRLEFLG